MVECAGSITSLLSAHPSQLWTKALPPIVCATAPYLTCLFTSLSCYIIILHNFQPASDLQTYILSKQHAHTTSSRVFQFNQNSNFSIKLIFSNIFVTFLPNLPFSPIFIFFIIFLNIFFHSFQPKLILSKIDFSY